MFLVLEGWIRISHDFSSFLREMAEAVSGAVEVKVGALRSFDEDGIIWLDEELEKALDHDYPDWKNPSKTYMVPCTFEMKGNRDEKGQLAEKKVFDLLHDFGNHNEEPMFVVHSYNFREKIFDWRNQRQDEKKHVRGEHDFLLLHRNYGMIFLQVKEATPSTKINRLASARKQLEKDKESLLHFTENKLRVDLKKKMKCERSHILTYVVMPNCQQGESPHSDGVFMENCENVEAFSKWWEENILPRTPPDQEVYNCLVTRFVGLSHDVPYPLSFAIEDSHKELMRHTSEQAKIFLNSTAEQWITGPAGSGKTWLLIEKVKQLSASQSGEKILVVCVNAPFSKRLDKEFKDCSRVVVKRFEELLLEITETERPFDKASQHDLIRLALEKLEQNTPQPEYDHIFVDECEDLIGGEWPVLFQKIWKGNEDDCGSTEVPGCKYKWYFYDPNQCGQYSDKHKLRKALATSSKLTRVLRNTGNIFDQCNKYFQGLDGTEGITLGHKKCGLNIEWQASLPSEMVTEKEGAHLVAKCIEKLRNENISEADVCVLVQNEDIRDQLSSELKVLDVDNHNAEDQFEGDHKNKVVVESIWRFKGLESKVVILYNPAFALTDIIYVIKLLYIALSRCNCYLVVITTKRGVAALKSKYGFDIDDRMTPEMLENVELKGPIGRTIRSLVPFYELECFRKPSRTIPTLVRLEQLSTVLGNRYVVHCVVVLNYKIVNGFCGNFIGVETPTLFSYVKDIFSTYEIRVCGVSLPESAEREQHLRICYK
ncbi:uncharacterized protein LOC122964953 [Acropora millepora]|uniref:uncharacterized protein LOC122964953 n=1 Tax=Acropora millepora TaxID=45264 RepID=UPI001CF1288F|nr:uncharacterized protein LOC122964953 [Acropora millepora]